MPNPFISAPVALPPAWAIVLAGNPSLVAGHIQGYMGTSSVVAQALRATAYAAPGTNAQRSINSTSANDTGAGTGAQQVTLTYLDTAFALHTETITLNGTTAVNTVGTNIAYIESIVVAQVGAAGGTNAGTIQLFSAVAGGGSVIASIAVNDNQTFWGQHYVPAGVTCYVLGMGGGATAQAGSVSLSQFNPSVTNSPLMVFGDTLNYPAPGRIEKAFGVPIAVPGPAEIIMIGRTLGSTSSTMFGSFDYMQF